MDPLCFGAVYIVSIQMCNAHNNVLYNFENLVKCLIFSRVKVLSQTKEETIHALNYEYTVW